MVVGLAWGSLLYKFNFSSGSPKSRSKPHAQIHSRHQMHPLTSNMNRELPAADIIRRAGNLDNKPAGEYRQTIDNFEDVLVEESDSLSDEIELPTTRESTPEVERKSPDEDPETPTTKTFHLRTDPDHRGVFVKTGNDEYSFYTYSAYWDEREEIMSAPVIRVIAMVSRSREILWDDLAQKMFCYVWCDGEVVKNVIRNHTQIEKTHVKHHVILDRMVITCNPGVCDVKDNSRVSLGFNDTWRDPKTKFDRVSVPLERSQRGNQGQPPMKLGNCLPAMFGHVDPHNLVEWLELQKLLGVDKVIMYNDSVSEETSKVVRHYSEEGYVVIRQMDDEVFIRDDINDVYARNQMAFTDCMYRYMFLFHRMMAVDVDEMIIPSNVTTIPKMISSLDELEARVKGPEVAKHRVTYTFVGGYFLMDLNRTKPDSKQPKRSVFLPYRIRRPWTWRYRKSVINPRGCLATRNHYCTVWLDYYVEHRRDRTLPRVSPEWGYVHHHRRQTQFEMDFKDAPDVADDIILRYAPQLTAAVEERLQTLRLEPFDT